MAANGRVLLLSEPNDERLATAFVAKLATQLPTGALDHFTPTFSFGAVPAWLVRESRARVDGATAVVCLLGATSVASAWITWAVTAALEAEKRVLCVRLHDSTGRDVPPPVVGERHVPVVNADPDAVLGFLERGVVPPERPAPPLPTPLANRLARRD